MSFLLVDPLGGLSLPLHDRRLLLMLLMTREPLLRLTCASRPCMPRRPRRCMPRRPCLDRIGRLRLVGRPHRLDRQHRLIAWPRLTPVLHRPRMVLLLHRLILQLRRMLRWWMVLRPRRHLIRRSLITATMFLSPRHKPMVSSGMIRIGDTAFLPVPASHRTALSEQAWHNAMEDEFDALQRDQTWRPNFRCKKTLECLKP
jgi:hypothetical protein